MDVDETWVEGVDVDAPVDPDEPDPDEPDADEPDPDEPDPVFATVVGVVGRTLAAVRMTAEPVVPGSSAAVVLAALVAAAQVAWSVASC